MKKNILFLILFMLMVFTMGVGAATLFSSNQVLYKNNTTVETALNDLYNKVNDVYKVYDFSELPATQEGECTALVDGSWKPIVPTAKIDKNGITTGQSCFFVATLPTSINVTSLKSCNFALEGIINKELSSSDSGEAFRLQNGSTAYPHYSNYLITGSAPVPVRNYFVPPSFPGQSYPSTTIYEFNGPFGTAFDLGGGYDIYNNANNTSSEGYSKTNGYDMKIMVANTSYSDKAQYYLNCHAKGNKVYFEVHHECYDGGTDGCSSNLGYATRASEFKLDGTIFYK